MKYQVGDLLITGKKSRLLIVDFSYPDGNKLLVGLNEEGQTYPFGSEDGTSLLVQQGTWKHFPVIK